MKAIFAKEVGTRAYLRIYWGEGCPRKGFHNAMKLIASSDIIEDWQLGDSNKGILAYPDEQWPNHCEGCGIAVPTDNTNKQIHHTRLYDTPSGNLEPGNLFYNTWLPENFYWDNHKGAHLCAVLPNGREWNIDSRASNCTLPDDRLHRCWVRHGEIPNLTINKNGLTCRAGAGSIWAGDWHGYLTNGEFKLSP